MSSIVSKFLSSKKFEILALLAVLTISGIAHGYNMFNYPYYENDEGVYMAQAWAIVTKGELAPYTYWYDHAPFGWMQIAAWTTLTGGFYTFDFPINTGRVFMLVMHLASSLVLYYIVKHLTKSKTFSHIAVLIFALTPLGIYFQRRVLLDNIMIFWVLLAVLFLLQYRNRLSKIIMSAIAIALAVLTKENAVFFIPFLLYYIYFITDKHHRSFAITQWILIQGFIISLYIAYALIKGEFFPPGVLLGDTQEHVSLIGAFSFQTARSGGSFFDPQNSEFWKSFNNIWIVEDPLLIYSGVLATAINTVLAFFNPNARLLAGLSLSFWYFLARGGFIIEFYIIPLIPILAANIAYALWTIYNALKVLLEKYPIRNLAYAVPSIFLTCWIIQFYTSVPNVRGGVNMYTEFQTRAQLEAIDWIRKYRDPKDFIVIDNYAYIELHREDKKNFPNAEWFSKIDTDREIREGKLNADYTNIDYLAVTPQVEFDTQDKGLFLVSEAFKNSRMIANFDYGYWRVRIYGALTPKRIAKASYESDRRHYIKEGRVEAPDKPNEVSLQHQSDMLFRAAYYEDKQAFSNIFNWTTKNLKKDNNLYANIWKDSQIIDKTADTIANADLAIALLSAYKKWNEPQYKETANQIITGLKQNNTLTWSGRVYMKPSDAQMIATQSATFNLSSLTPNAYTLFGNEQAQDKNYWERVKNVSYELLNDCTFTETKKVLPPTTCTLTQGTATTKPQVIGTSNRYDQSVFRVPLKVALDYAWTKDTKAKAYIDKLTSYKKEWTTRYQMGAAYDQEANVKEDYETIRTYAAALSVINFQDKARAKELWDLKVRNTFQEDPEKTFWEDIKNPDNQTLGWYATLIYGDLMPNPTQ